MEVIRFLTGRCVNVVRRRGRKFVYRPSIVIGEVKFWPRALSRQEIEDCYMRGNEPPGAVTFRGEAFTPFAVESR